MKHALTVVSDGVLLADVREKPDAGVVWFPIRNERVKDQDLLVTYSPRTDKERQYLLRVLKQGAQVHLVADMAIKLEGEGASSRLRLLLAAYRCEVRAEAPERASEDSFQEPVNVGTPADVPASHTAAMPPPSPAPRQPAPTPQAPPLRASAPPVNAPAREPPNARPAAPQAPAVFPHVNDRSWG